MKICAQTDQYDLMGDNTKTVIEGMGESYTVSGFDYLFLMKEIEEHGPGYIDFYVAALKTAENLAKMIKSTDVEIIEDGELLILKWGKNLSCRAFFNTIPEMEHFVVQMRRKGYTVGGTRLPIDLHLHIDA